VLRLADSPGLLDKAKAQDNYDEKTAVALRSMAVKHSVERLQVTAFHERKEGRTILHWLCIGPEEAFPRAKSHVRCAVQEEVCLTCELHVSPLANVRAGGGSQGRASERLCC
jgi:hypothetical protein